MAGFISVLHMYESFGWWRRADYLKVHFAESWNEMHHLLIMEVRYLTTFFHLVQRLISKDVILQNLRRSLSMSFVFEGSVVEHIMNKLSEDLIERRRKLRGPLIITMFKCVV